MSAAHELEWAIQSPPSPKLGLEHLFEQAPVGIAEFEQPDHVVALNPALESIYSLPKRQRSVVLSDLLRPEDQERGERLLRELFAGEQESFQAQFVSPQHDHGSVHWSAWRVPAGNGEADRVLAVVENRDSGADEHLRHAQRLEVLGRLAGGVAHDFNNMITGVLLYCDLLLAGLEPNHRARPYAEEIREAGQQATGLVRQLLTLSRPTKPEPQLLSLNDVAESMRDFLQRLIGRNIQFDLRLDRSLGLVRMDPTQARQVLLNLVLNARDAMPEGGKITIETANCAIQVLTESGLQSVSTSLPCALFVVEDTGTGMDAGTKAHLFEAFFTTKSGKGTGLGLTTVHSIITSNGGLIHVDSVPNQGTRFSVLLPLAPMPAMQFAGSSSVQKAEGEFLPITKE